MVTVLTSKFATARSSFPSPLKSPIASPNGVPVAGGEETGVKVPSPGPSRMVRVLSVEFATARSSFPSPVKSPMARAVGPAPTLTGELDGGMSPIALAQQDGDAVIVIIRHRQVQLSVAINV